MGSKNGEEKKRKRGRPKKSERQPVVEAEPLSAQIRERTKEEIVGDLPPVAPFEPNFPPADFPPTNGGISDPVRVLRLAYLQSVIEKLRAQELSYKMTFDTQIRDLVARKESVMVRIRSDLTLADQQYCDIQREIENIHKISLRDFAYNVESGTLHEIKKEEVVREGTTQ